MTTTPRASVAAPAAVLSLALVTAASWQWQQQVARSARAQDRLTMDPWEQVKSQYALPADPGASPVISAELFEAVVSANPFSPERRTPAAGAAGPGTGTPGHAVEPPAPKFAFRGRINVGSHKRAIVEDLAGHKTYFLEVGQEVAGFKVLDIAETQVVLSDAQSHEAVILSLASTSGP